MATRIRRAIGRVVTYSYRYLLCGAAIEAVLLALLAVAELFENYDAAIVSIAMLQIQAGLQIPESQIGAVAGLIRLGMLGSFGITLFADRFGRRRLLLLTVLGFSIFTGLTAFAESMSPRRRRTIKYLNVG